MGKSKIFNDPVYGFVTVPHGIVFDLVEHPYFQRLRRIKQLGMTDYVYPGALHTRFQHALGALHLAQEAVQVLRSKGIDITDEEARALAIGILLHDIGHGPFSHALEHTLLNVHHESLSLLFMEELNRQFKGELDMAIAIFTGAYEKPFLHQLVSSQLDMDRMDYLNRDSYFTGVHEGVIGYDRIVKMLSVKDGELVVEEKGIYSVEKFLVARRLMYWQVYLHKTVLAAEQMLIQCLRRAKHLAMQGVSLPVSLHLGYFLYGESTDLVANGKAPSEVLEHYAAIDDHDIVSALKSFTETDDFVLAYLSKSLLDRHLFKTETSATPFSSDYLDGLRQMLQKSFNNSRADDINYFLIQVTESNVAYDISKDEIKILFKNGQTKPMSEIDEPSLHSKKILKHYLCYPKTLL
jgi:HD superfamily phosphohydrolase